MQNLYTSRVLPDSFDTLEAPNLASSLRFQNDGIPLVAGNDAVELFQILGAAHGYAQFFHFERAAVVDQIPFTSVFA
jgi:hypothetical protein